jgi:P4 family phage/plasmid primase-like protien
MNTTMSVSSQYKDLNEFMAKHLTKGGQPTHTRIPDKELNIYGGAYIIPADELGTFYNLYYDHVFTKKRKEYLTEKQLDNNGAMVVDFDFRYNYDVETRQHTTEHVQDMILLYLEELKTCYTFEENKSFQVFIFEKPNVNRLADKTVTKDGIHMLIGIKVDYTMQKIIREQMLEKLPEVWDMPLINGWDAVLDEGISKGTTNWQLFGSRKPSNEAYELTQHFSIRYDKTDGEFMMDERRVEDFDMKANFRLLSVQNDSNPSFAINPKIVEKYNKHAESKVMKIKRPASKTKMNLLMEQEELEEDQDVNKQMSLKDIVNKETLERAVELMLNGFKADEYDLKELHYYTQILPPKYYEPGSHLLNRQVAFALKHTDARLFLSWVQLRSKASDFDYDDIPNLYNSWHKHFKNSKDGGSITKKSILYWAKQDALQDYEKVKSQTVDYYLDEAVNSQTEFDLAQVLKQMFKDKYVCSSLTGKGVWYVFKNHRWEPDKGLTLRMKISREMYHLLSSKSVRLADEMNHYDAEDKRRETIEKRIRIIHELGLKLKRTNDKNNILREAQELFYDNEFTRNIDTNCYLLCFNNGVVDFKNKIFRDGYPQDYITKTTGIDYVDFNNDIKSEFSKSREEILQFMEKLFPIPELNVYMWRHLASCLIGTNKNQTFNVYHGSGSNGKSILTDLMSETLGDYKGTVPISLVTDKRNSIGGTSSEVMQLKGVRYAVMQEPSKGVKLNEGIMKELTGGDPIQGRELYCESQTFMPQFKLVVCTNNLFDIESNDDGTWRRIRKCDFMSKFIDEGETHTDDTQYVFTKDKALKEKLPEFAPIFASMLVKLAYETDGIVEDCDVVMSASNKYRKGQDHIAAFIADNVEKTGDIKNRIRKNELANAFKFWFQQEQGTNRKVPKGQELYDFMDKKFGLHNSAGWSGVRIKYPDATNDIDDLTE